MAEWTRATRALGEPREISAGLPPAGSAVVIGHSLGGVQALKIAAAHPAQVRALVLTNSFFPPARDGRSIAATLADYGRHRALYLREVARRKRTPRPTLRGVHELGELARMGIHPEAFYGVASSVKCPVLVVHANDDHLVPVAFARAASRRCPTWTYHELGPAGHFAHRDQPEAWAEILRAWLLADQATP
jgi:pimeloyl-ACP methyl ester carboxylesterase